MSTTSGPGDFGPAKQAEYFLREKYGWGVATPQTPDQSATKNVTRQKVGERTTDWEPPRATEMPQRQRKPLWRPRAIAKGSR